MSNTLNEGDLIDIYYILPQKCFKDVGIVKSVNSFEYKSFLGGSIREFLEDPTVSKLFGLTIGKAMIKIGEKFIQWLPKRRFWPAFFPELLKEDKGLQEHLDTLVHSIQIGKQPPSTDIYPQATEELWSVQVTHSEALRAELRSTPGLLPLISSCKNNENLVAKICIADPERLLPEIAETEINAIYGEVEGEKIQSKICHNAYPHESLVKFLYPWDLDYIRKLNDTYAALWLLKYNAEKEGVDNQIDFYTYKNDPTLRATFVYGESKILDFVYFPESWIGMTGIICRCEVLDGTPINSEIFKKAERERESMNLGPRNDLIETMEDKLIEKLDERGLNTVSFDNNGTKKEMTDKYNKIDKNLKHESYGYEERKKFLIEIQKGEKGKLVVTPEPEIIVLPHK